MMIGSYPNTLYLSVGGEQKIIIIAPLNEIPIRIPKTTQSKSCLFSLAEYSWEFQNNASWDALQSHTAKHKKIVTQLINLSEYPSLNLFLNSTQL